MNSIYLHACHNVLIIIILNIDLIFIERLEEEEVGVLGWYRKAKTVFLTQEVNIV